MLEVSYHNGASRRWLAHPPASKRA